MTSRNVFPSEQLIPKIRKLCRHDTEVPVMPDNKTSECALTNAKCYHISTPISRGGLSGVSLSDAKLVPEKRLFYGLQPASTAVDAELKAGKLKTVSLE